MSRDGSIHPTFEGVIPPHVVTKLHPDGQSERNFNVPKAGAEKCPRYSILYIGTTFTYEQVYEPDGAFHCYHCWRSIVKDRLYFIPQKYRADDETYEVIPVPHCRPECAKATMLANHLNYLQIFHEFYGRQVVTALPRELLKHFIPGGFTIEEYHEKIDQGVLYRLEPANIRQTFGPMYISVTKLNDEYNLPATQKDVDTALTSRTVLSRTREDAKGVQYEEYQGDPMKTDHLSGLNPF